MSRDAIAAFAADDTWGLRSPLKDTAPGAGATEKDMSAVSRVVRISLAGEGEGAPPSPSAAARRPANGNRRPPAQRQDWLESKLKGLYDEVAGEPLPDALQKLIDQLDG